MCKEFNTNESESIVYKIGKAIGEHGEKQNWDGTILIDEYVL